MAEILAISLLGDNEELEDQLKLTKKALANLQLQNIALQVQSVFQSNPVTSGHFERDPSSEIKGLVLKHDETHTELKIRCDGYTAMKICRLYNIDIELILKAEANVILDLIKETDPNNIYPITQAYNKNGEVRGLRFGENLQGGRVCCKSVANYILLKLNRKPVDDLPQCSCTIF